MDRLLTWHEAADYCGVPKQYLHSMVMHGSGPLAIKPSPKKTLFRRVDLEKWMDSWVVKVDVGVERPFRSAGD